MANYFLRRLLLIIPTFIGMTMLVFMVTRFVPGGPVERAIMQLRGAGGAGEGGSVSGSGSSDVEIPTQALEDMKRYYGFDKPWYVQYFHWLLKVVRFDLGKSWVWNKPVLDVIADRLPVSIFIGMLGFFISYAVCIPLGIGKALRHGTPFDFASSALVFAGYSIPGWVVGVLLLMYLGGRLDMFPLRGWQPMDWEMRTAWGKFVGVAHHAALPVFCYMLGHFATLTILTKNSLLENLSADYVRTAYAKGLGERRVIFLHAMRNSMIPLATNLGHIFSVILAGSYLIERVFTIDGIGLLGFTSLVKRDFPVALGTLVISSLLMMIGNILSDLLYCLFDPRIRFK